ncbi:hypothetical protein HZB07_01685 [Candidatus Saganbacteria bacterium]|nr:hypothetical protein [Candidatus Saganbacteria bacterium]
MTGMVKFSLIARVDAFKLKGQELKRVALRQVVTTGMRAAVAIYPAVVKAEELYDRAYNKALGIILKIG